jgi:phage baseplate assembly protein gpV
MALGINGAPPGGSGGFETADQANRVDATIRIGKIVECRYDNEGKLDSAKPEDDPSHFTNEDRANRFRGALYRVQMSDKKYYWIPQMHRRAGNDQEYWAYEKGEQVVVIAPAGEPTQAFIIGALPTDDFRPPVGFDDLSKDKRPWRESVYRKRFKDGMMTEYDRYLHRLCTVFEDGTLYMDWFKDTREDRTPRKKETNSDKKGVPPRHWKHRLYADKLDHEILWDEDTQIHRRHFKWPDAALFEYQWDEKNQTHFHHWLFADKAEYRYLWDEKKQFHAHHWIHADKTEYFYQWDEKAQTHHQRWTWQDGHVTWYLWDEKNKVHQRKKIYADGRTWEYVWNEQQEHLRTDTLADGTVEKYHWKESGDSHLSETAFADGTVMRYHFNDPHKHEILYADGSSVIYDLKTHNMTVNIVKDGSVTCGGKLSAHANEVVSISSNEAIVLSAPVISLKGMKGGKNVLFEGDFAFKGTMDMVGQVNIQGATNVKGNTFVDGDLIYTGAHN